MNASIDKPATTVDTAHFCPLWRRLAAVIYDAILLVCVVFIAWQPVPAVPLDSWPLPLARGARLLYLFAVCYVFFGWFWTHGGQTLGMRAWRIRVVSYPELGSIGWRQALQRFAMAVVSWSALGLGFLWSLFRSDRRTWHDLASTSCLVVVEKRSKQRRRAKTGKADVA